uniref:Uncharacterized protein n=1 Tax=Romanomermis culicivorax TaxID=13658 RepID=A0A915IPJ9_ROMCU
MNKESDGGDVAQIADINRIQFPSVIIPKRMPVPMEAYFHGRRVANTKTNDLGRICNGFYNLQRGRKVMANHA